MSTFEDIGRLRQEKYKISFQFPQSFFAKFTHFIAVNQDIINFTEKSRATETAVSLSKAIFDFGTTT